MMFIGINFVRFLSVCILSRLRKPILVYREKNLRQGRKQDKLEDTKRVRSQNLHNVFWATALIRLNLRNKN